MTNEECQSRFQVAAGDGIQGPQSINPEPIRDLNEPRWEQEHAPYSVAGVELAPIAESDSPMKRDELRCVISDLSDQCRERDKRIRQLEAENARLRESLQTHNNAGIDVTMQLQTLREAVADFADGARRSIESATGEAIADRLDAILKGEGE